MDRKTVIEVVNLIASCALSKTRVWIASNNWSDVLCGLLVYFK